MDDMTELEHLTAWAIYNALGQLKRSGNQCEASCGCKDDPIVVIVNVMRSVKKPKRGRAQVGEPTDGA